MMKPRTVRIGDAEYPRQLREYPFSPPDVLYVLGKPMPSDEPVIGVAGTREPTEYGRELAYRLGMELARAGFVIATGFAAGVDAETVRGAVSVGGHVIGVLPYLYEDGGMRQLANNQLLHELLSSGYDRLTIVSENLVKDVGKVSQWLAMRNRIIDGLSRAIIIVETKYRQKGWGTIHHVRFGIGAGKPILIFKPTWTTDWYVWLGYKEFVDNGAKIVQSINEVIDFLK
mgnify:FL=1